jgi:tRNA/tmRNA/rRNA uracil-C5-methylase (TrmA/RlmC/RlmD family)
VEPFRPAARAAEHNLPDARVVKGRTAEAFLGRQGRLPDSALVLTDPPRSGMSKQLRRQLAGWHPQRLLMMACDPATWARDAAWLQQRGYAIRHLELVDLFPSTHHVEVLAVLEST